MDIKTLTPANPSKTYPPTVASIQDLPDITSDAVKHGEDFVVLGDGAGHKFSANKTSGVWERGFSLTPGDGLKTYIDAGDASTLESAKALMANLQEPVSYSYDASGNTYPASGSGDEGEVLQNDSYWVGTVGTEIPFRFEGTQLIAKVDNPGQTASNWVAINRHISYVPANAASYSRVLYVDKRGNDNNAGNQLNPFLTVSAAIVQAKTMTPTTSAPVNILIGPGVWAEQITIDVAGINLYGYGQGITHLQCAGTCLNLENNGVDNPSYDFKSVGISYYSTDAAEYSVSITGLADNNMGGAELQFRDCRIQGTKSIYATLVNYIDFQNTYIMGSQLYEQVAGIWFEDSESAGAITETYDTEGSKPSDTGHYGLFFVRHIPRGTVTGLIGEDYRPIPHKLDGFSASYGEVAATDTHQAALEKIVGTQDARRGEFAYIAGANGDDSYAGSQQKPFATLAQGIAGTSSGDTIYLLPNNNYTENMVVADGESRHIVGLSAENGCLLNGTLTFNQVGSGAFFGAIKNLYIRKKTLINVLGGQRFTDCKLVGPEVSITSITRSGTTATAIVASTASLTTGEYVKIFGANESNFNGSVVVTVADGTTFTYPVADAGATEATGTLAYYPNTLQVVGDLTNNITFDRGSIQRGDIVIASTSATNDIQLKNGWFPADMIINGGVVQISNASEVGNITLNAGILLLTDNKLLKRITINATSSTGAVYLIGHNSLLQVDSTFEKIVRADASKNAPIVCMGHIVANSALHELYTTPITFMPLQGHANVKEIDLTSDSWALDGAYYMSIAYAVHGMTKITDVTLQTKISGTGQWVKEHNQYWDVNDTTKALGLNRGAAPWAVDPDGTSGNYVGKLFINGLA